MIRYNETGVLVCGKCGKEMARSSNKFNDSVASCNDTGCEEYGRMVEEGSLRHDPQIPVPRRIMQMPASNYRFIAGTPNYKVVNGERTED